MTASPWTAEDRALMLARAAHYRARCRGCGMPLDVAWQLEEAEDDPAGYFEIGAVHVCHGCSEIKNHDHTGAYEPVKYLSPRYVPRDQKDGA